MGTSLPTAVQAEDASPVSAPLESIRCADYSRVQYRRVTGRTITRDEARSVIELNYEEY